MNLFSNNNFIFCNKKINKIKTGPFPSYFYKDSNNLYYHPKLNSVENEVVYYVVDKPIQNLMYLLQNMNYYVDGYKHIIEYDFYYCDYNSYKIVFRDIKKIREDKINSIIS